MVLPVIAAFTLAASVISAKEVLSRFKMKYLPYTVFVFAGLAGWMLLGSPFFGRITPGMFSSINLLLFACVVIVAFFYNLVLYKGIKYETLNESELIIMTTPLFATFLSYIVFPDERNLYIVIPTLIASFALLWSHYEDKHVTFSVAGKCMLIYAFLYAVEAIFLKLLVESWTPYMIYFLRCSVLLVLLGLYIKPKQKDYTMKQVWYAILSALPAVFTYTIVYWSYSNHGIVFTNLILNLAPVIVFSYAYLVRKELLEFKKIIASIIVLICVISVIFL